MSGFEARWLDLREPVDRQARAQQLRRKALDHVEARGEDALVVDLGCGTGSTYRALLPDASKWRWRLIDNDPALLREAGRRHGDGRMTVVEADLARPPRQALADACLVTASALFDLCSEDFVRTIAGNLPAQAGLYAALNYDGQCAWDAPHAADAIVVDAFNMHQRTDKGFGPALGPDSGPRLKAVLETGGFTVSMESSPWNIGPDHAELHRRFIEGMAEAVGETGMVEASLLGDWRAFRLGRVEGSSCSVGHWDVLALR